MKSNVPVYVTLCGIPDYSFSLSRFYVPNFKWEAAKPPWQIVCDKCGCWASGNTVEESHNKAMILGFRRLTISNYRWIETYFTTLCRDCFKKTGLI